MNGDAYLVNVSQVQRLPAPEALNPHRKAQRLPAQFPNARINTMFNFSLRFISCFLSFVSSFVLFHGLSYALFHVLFLFQFVSFCFPSRRLAFFLTDLQMFINW